MSDKMNNFNENIISEINEKIYELRNDIDVYLNLIEKHDKIVNYLNSLIYDNSKHMDHLNSLIYKLKE